MSFLASVPGKLKQILDRWDSRLSSTRAGKIDNMDATISSRAPASTALSNSVWTNTRASKLDNLDTTVSSRLNLSGLQTELNNRSVDATHLNRLDTSVSSRLASSDAALDMLRPATGIYTVGGFFVSSTVTADLYELLHVAKLSVPKNTSTWQVIYSRTGRGGIVCAAANFGGGGNVGFRIIIDGSLLWSATTSMSGSAQAFVGPIGCFVLEDKGTGYYNVHYRAEGIPIKYNSSVSIEAYTSNTNLDGTVFYKEYRY